MAWWSYTFPMTTASLATIKYAEAVPSGVTKAMVLALSAMSSTMVAVLFVSTLLHAFVWRTLFPNDLAIAITKNKVTGGGKKGESKKWEVRQPGQPPPPPVRLVSPSTFMNKRGRYKGEGSRGG